MVLTAGTLPVSIVPFLILMNDPHYMQKHTNGWLSNFIVLATIALALVLAIVSVPLQSLEADR